MTITLVHQCLFTIPEIIFDDLLFGVQTINSFCSKIEQNSTRTSLDPNQFKGDILELFTEYLLKTRGSDNRIGINEYQLVQETDLPDLGVDGIGIGANQKPATVQVKYRHHDYILTANEDHLSNFMVQSWSTFNVDMNDTMNMLIVTTAQDIHHHTHDNMLQGKVRTLARPQLRQLVDNDTYFWSNFFSSVKESLKVAKASRQVITLRPHQEDAITAILNDENAKGKIILPTGTGKTVVEAETILKHITTSHNPQIIKVYASRILLCFQLIKDVQEYLLSHDIDVDFVNFNSGQLQDTEYIKQYVENGFIGRKIQSTTSNLELLDLVNKSHQEGRTIVIFSTYHSAVRSQRDDIHVNLSIFDEAHNTVNEEFQEAVDLQSDKKFFFTATEKLTESDEGFGMNNEARYDDMIFIKTPKEMIDAGEICKPFIHVVKTDIDRPSGLNDAPDAIVHSIFSAFLKHNQVIKDNSTDSSKIGAKVIVAVEGQNILRAIMNSDELNEYCKEYPHIHIGAISSEFGIYYDGEHTTNVNNMAKHKFLENIKSLNHNDLCIIFHVDMIGEGIDIPGITGVMPFRNQNVIKFVQFLGRAMRLHPIDKARFYKGEISLENMDDYIKPYAWIIIPDFLQNSADFGERYKIIVRNMKYHYGFNPTEHIIYDDRFGIDDPDAIQPVNESNSSNPFDHIGMVNYEHELESIELNSEIEQTVETLIQRVHESGNHDFSILTDYLKNLT
ncbi:MAG: DEAD/DEAH box helicase [Petrotogales bacterium]